MTTTRTPERQQILNDVFVTAMYGGIGYWSVAADWSEEVDDFFAYIEDTEDDDARYTIDADVIARGINRILDGTVGIRSDLLDQVKSTRSYDECDVDADAADCIVQVGLFGEIRYG